MKFPLSQIIGTDESERKTARNEETLCVPSLIRGRKRKKKIVWRWIFFLFRGKVKVKIRKSFVYASFGRIKSKEKKTERFLCLSSAFKCQNTTNGAKCIGKWKCGREAKREKSWENYNNNGTHCEVAFVGFVFCINYISIHKDDSVVGRHCRTSRFSKKLKALQKFFFYVVSSSFSIKRSTYNNYIMSQLLLRSLAPKLFGEKEKENQLFEWIADAFFFLFLSPSEENFLSFLRSPNGFWMNHSEVGGLVGLMGFGLYLWNTKHMVCYR